MRKHTQMARRVGVCVCAYYHDNTSRISSFFRKMVNDRNKKLEELQQTHTTLQTNATKISENDKEDQTNKASLVSKRRGKGMDPSSSSSLLLIGKAGFFMHDFEGIHATGRVD